MAGRQELTGVKALDGSWHQIDVVRTRGLRLARERRTVEAMIRLFCRAHHGGSALCDDCRALAEYATRRLDGCPYGEGKPTCVHCPIHCYAPTRREEIRRVMRWSGPRLLWRHPVLAIRHLLDGRRREGSVR